MTLIDLGEVRDVPPPEPSRRPPRRPSGRLLPCLAVLAFALATLTAAALPAERVAAAVPAPPGAGLLVAGDLLLVVDPIGERPTARTVTAYRLDGGEPLWRVPLPVDAGRLWSVPMGSDAVVLTGQETDGPGTSTMALDPATGALRWRIPAGAVDRAGDGLLVQTFGSGADRGTVQVVDPCCGTLRWRVATPAGEVSFRSADEGVDRVVFSDPGGRVEVRDAASGAVLAAADLWSPEDRPYGSTQVIGDLLVTVGGTPPTVTAYGLDRLDRRWRVPIGDARYATPCGPLVCVQSEGGRLRALDPATGTPRWTEDRWDGFWQVGGVLVTDLDRPAGPSAEYVLLDPATGRVLGSWGQWEITGPDDPGGRLVGTRPYPGGGLLVAELDTTTHRARPLDVLREAAGECQVARDRLVCRRIDGAVGLWRLPR
ncbi:PQQ-binding-like beta-propeller repeat protein [Micromonospora sp. NPDC049799]|uniref:outer membrane protein assembly factor BamB family protein n=1 Tax=Micromonospora sp. NPDC049799 TaxID=3154741 RepID=UPI0033EFF5AA